MTIETLQTKLDNFETTSVELVKTYLNRIQQFDTSLNSLADINHEALIIAEQLDLERKTTGKRSLLHGIPIVVKDNILTHDTMRTTANSYALRNFYAPFDATIIKKLRAAGAIILAKANCSEFAYFMAMGEMPSGYGSMHGQVKHPYNTKIDPLGSSTGSAVAVAADLAVASIGTETNGSLVSPATQNSVVTIKPTLGLVSRFGIIPITLTQDTAGPMTKTVKDAAIMLDIINGSDDFDSATKRIPHSQSSYLAACNEKIINKRIGMLTLSNYKNSEEENAIFQEAKDVLKKQGAEIITLDFTYKLENNLKTLIPEFKRDINAFLASVKPHCEMQTLKDIIDFNQTHNKRCLKYGQSIFLAAQATDGRLKDSDYLNAKLALGKDVEQFLNLFEKHNLDAIITPKITGYPPIGGLPVISVPAKPLTDETPKNLQFIGKAFTEHTLLGIAHSYECATNHRINPNLSQHKIDNAN